jgi:hypothetical protein
LFVVTCGLLGLWVAFAVPIVEVEVFALVRTGLSFPVIMTFGRLRLREAAAVPFVVVVAFALCGTICLDLGVTSGLRVAFAVPIVEVEAIPLSLTAVSLPVVTMGRLGLRVALTISVVEVVGGPSIFTVLSIVGLTCGRLWLRVALTVSDVEVELWPLVCTVLLLVVGALLRVSLLELTLFDTSPKVETT